MLWNPLWGQRDILMTWTALLVWVFLVQWPYFLLHCHICTGTKTDRHWQQQYSEMLFAQQVICLPFIWNLFVVWRARCTHNTVWQKRPFCKRACFWKEKHRGCLPLHSPWQQACRAQRTGLTDSAEENTTAEPYSIGQAGISQKKAPEIQDFALVWLLLWLF